MINLGRFTVYAVYLMDLSLLFHYILDLKNRSAVVISLNSGR